MADSLNARGQATVHSSLESRPYRFPKIADGVAALPVPGIEREAALQPQEPTPDYDVHFVEVAPPTPTPSPKPHLGQAGHEPTPLTRRAVHATAVSADSLWGKP